MSNVKFTDNSIQVINAINQEILNALEEASGELEAQVKRNPKVDKKKKKNSWTHKVDEHKYEAYVGSNYENAIWEEFGTGVYAQNGNGRKDVPWTYQDEQGKWHRTKGKKPRKALQKAFNSMKNRIERFFKERFKDL